MWYSSTPPEVAAAAPKCFNSVRSGWAMSPVITGWSSPATPPAKYPSMPQSWNVALGPATVIRCVPWRLRSGGCRSRDLPGQRRRPGRGDPLAVGPRAEHRVRVDHRGRLHPGAVLAAQRQVPHLVRRAGGEDVRPRAARSTTPRRSATRRWPWGSTMPTESGPKPCCSWQVGTRIWGIVRPWSLSRLMTANALSQPPLRRSWP